MAQYLPQLMELDHYWEKAIEDAIRDAVKGKKRLLHALVTRDKLNKKIEKLIVISRAFRNKQKENLKKDKINRAKNNSKKKNKKGETLDSVFRKWKGNVTTKCLKSFRELKTQKNKRCQGKTKRRKSKRKKVIPSPLFKKKPNLKNFEKMKKSRNNFTEPMDSLRCLKNSKKRRAPKILQSRKLAVDKKHRNKKAKNYSRKIKKGKSRTYCGKKLNKKANSKKNRISGKQNNIETIYPAKKGSRCRCRKKGTPCVLYRGKGINR